jgi:NAD-specific glutamate dehydrogenase
LRRYVQDAVSVDVERHLDLRQTAGRRRNTVQVKSSQCLIIPGHWSFAFQDLDIHSGLVVAVGRKSLLLARGHRRIPGNHRRRNSTGGFNRKCQWCNVEQKHGFHVAPRHAPLNSRTHSDFVWVNTFVRLFADQLARRFDDLWHTGHSANQHQFIDISLRELGVGEAGRLLSSRRFPAANTFCARQTFATFGEGNNRWRGACTLRIFNNNRFSTLHHGHTGVGGAEVNP